MIEKYRFKLILLLVLLSGCQPASEIESETLSQAEVIANVFNHGNGRWVDLTHSFSSDSIYWPTDVQGFELERLDYGYTDGGWFYSSYRYSGAEQAFVFPWVWRFPFGNAARTLAPAILQLHQEGLRYSDRPLNIAK